MAQRKLDLLLRGGECVLPSGVVRCDVGILEGRIALLGEGDETEAQSVIDARGLTILPGVMDVQVHFREPGLEHKEDLHTGTLAAVMGGVTAVFEMPNTTPPTTSMAALHDKLRRAHGRVYCDIAFFVGATAGNIQELAALEQEPGCCGVKVFMGSSTGTLLVPDDETLRQVFLHGKRRVALHAEDESRLIARKSIAEKAGRVQSHPEWRDAECARLATARAVALAKETGRPIHVLHVTTEEEIPLLAKEKPLVTFEVPPQHLTFAAPECYDRLGTLAQMNPPIREERHRKALWAAIEKGWVDVIATDHAPHTLEEKAQPYPKSPSGMPGVQTLVPVMLNHVHEGRLSLQQMVELLCAGPARIYGIKDRGRLEVGALGSLTVVDLNARRTITNDWIKSRVGWTPFAGMEVVGWPVATIVRGNVVMLRDQLMGEPLGEPVAFENK